ncbi:MAG: hypothetical protein KatS3mg101_0971 [Patescibacteria group bacterium]|nr:MAG: hypothetical protein KatS3mg101_0971 [Patescibacteria group bacterium]
MQTLEDILKASASTLDLDTSLPTGNELTNSYQLCQPSNLGRLKCGFCS